MEKRNQLIIITIMEFVIGILLIVIGSWFFLLNLFVVGISNTSAKLQIIGLACIAIGITLVINSLWTALKREMTAESNTKAHSKSRMSNNGIITITIIAILLISLIIIANIGNGGQSIITPPINVKKETAATVITWTVTDIPGGSAIPKSNVCVQLRNASGLVIDNESLMIASGTHGFIYYSTASISDVNISIGDVFSLSIEYLEGCSIRLISFSTQGQYAILTV